jgi:hypothetical protein
VQVLILLLLRLFQAVQVVAVLGHQELQQALREHLDKDLLAVMGFLIYLELAAAAVVLVQSAQVLLPMAQALLVVLVRQTQ